MDKIPITPMGERILVKDIKNLSMITGGFAIDVEETSMLSKSAEVVSIGTMVDLDKFYLEPGDYVFHTQQKSDIFRFKNEDYFFIKPAEIISKTSKNKIKQLTNN